MLPDELDVSLDDLQTTTHEVSDQAADIQEICSTYQSARLAQADVTNGLLLHIAQELALARQDRERAARARLDGQV